MLAIIITISSSAVPFAPFFLHSEGPLLVACDLLAMASGSDWASVLRFILPFLTMVETAYLPKVCVGMSSEWSSWYKQKKRIFYEESIACAFVGQRSEIWVLAHPHFGLIHRRLIYERDDEGGFFWRVPRFFEDSDTDTSD